MKKLRMFSPVLLRIGVSLVFLWFGTNQLSDPTNWVAYVPQSIVDISHVSVTVIVYLNGIFEIVAGAALLLGIFTRTAALLLALHILDITLIVGLDATGVRDFGISIATVCVWLNGMDWLSLDRYMRRGPFALPQTVIPPVIDESSRA